LPTSILSSTQFAKEVLDHLRTKLVLIDLKNVRLVDMNRSMLEFLEYADLNSFFQEHECICEFFAKEQRDGYLSYEDLGSIWIKKILNEEGFFKVLMKEHIFKVEAYTIQEEYVIASFEDITQEENRMQERLQSSVDRALMIHEDELLDLMPVPAATIDQNSFVIKSNKKFDQYFAYRYLEPLNLEDRFVKRDGYIFKEKVFDWKEGSLDVCTLIIKKVLIDLAGEEIEFALNVQKIKDEGHYLVCLTPLLEMA